MTTKAIGFSKDLPTSRTMRAIVDDIDLVIWRSKSGIISAWENRCPHRGMRLSHGFVRGESLACIYHGWQFSTEAKCHHIPALPELKPAAALSPKSYDIAEKHNIIWVSVTGEPEPASISETMVPLRSLTFDCSITQAQAAFAETSLASFIELSNPAVNLDTEQDTLSITSTQNTTEVTVVFQHQNDATVTAHLMANKQWTRQQRVALSRWCEHVRRVAELESHKEQRG